MDIFVPETNLSELSFLYTGSENDQLQFGDDLLTTSKSPTVFDDDFLLEDINVQPKTYKYKCEYGNCEAAFQRFDDLTRHKYMHTGVVSIINSSIRIWIASLNNLTHLPIVHISF